MKSDVETLSPTRVKLTVEVPFEELKPSMDAAYGRIAKSVNVPGFRKGKVPARIIEQRFGRGAVLEEAVNDALPKAYDEAIADQRHRAGRPSGDRRHRAGGRPEPDLHRRGRRASRVRPARLLQPHRRGRQRRPRPTRTSTPQLDSLRGRFATLNDVDRAAADGDVLLVDIAGATPEGDAVEDLVGNALSYELGTDGMLPGFDDAVRGAAKDEVRTFEFTPENGDWTGIPLTVTATVKAVRERELPALDDDFAQLASASSTPSTSCAPTCAPAWSASSASSRAPRPATRCSRCCWTSVDIPLPENLIAAEVEAHFEDGHDSGDEHRAEVEQQTRESLKSQFVLDKIAEKEEVSVGETELSAWLLQQAPRYGMSPDAFAQALVEAGQVPMAIQDIRRAKALAVVLESAKVVDADGNVVDLSALDAEMNRMQGMPEMVEIDEEIDVYTDEDGNVVEVDVIEEIVEVDEK